MKISVVTPTHNKKDLLGRTLGSLALQDIDPSSVEVIVVDDCSTDGTSDFLETFRPDYTIRVVRFRENLGRAVARNRGLEMATGDLVVFLDDDMVLVPGFLRAHADFHRGNDRLIGIGNVRNHPSITLAPVDRYMSTRGAQKIGTKGPLPWRYFSTNNASVLRADLEKVGGFDENFIYYGFEDMELAFRLERELGLSIRFVEGACSLHLHAHSLDELLEKKRVAGRHSLRYLFQKHPEVKSELRYERFDPPVSGDPIGLNTARMVYGVLFTRPIYTMVKPFAGLSLGRVTDLCIDYLIQYEYLRGLREHSLSVPVP